MDKNQSGILVVICNWKSAVLNVEKIDIVNNQKVLRLTQPISEILPVKLVLK